MYDGRSVTLSAAKDLKGASLLLSMTITPIVHHTLGSITEMILYTDIHCTQRIINSLQTKAPGGLAGKASKDITHKQALQPD